MKYIHYTCLKNSIKLKYHKKSEKYYDMFVFQNYSCEICQKEYPKYFKVKDTLYPLIDLDINYLSYIICDYSLYDDMKDDLYDAHTKADFYKACVDIDDEIEDKFGVSPRPSMDVRLYIEDRNLNDEPVFDNSGKDKEKDKGESDRDSIWPKNGAYVDYDGNTYATREEVQEAVNSGKISCTNFR